MIVRKREHAYKTSKGYLVISYRYQRESTGLYNWIMVIISICVVLFGILGYETPFWGIRGFIIGFGIYLTYTTLVIAVDERQLWLRGNKLVVKYKPLPQYRRNNNIELANIKKAELKVRSNSRTPVIPWVDLKLKNGKTKKLVVASNIDEAKEIAEEINRALQELREGKLR